MKKTSVKKVTKKLLITCLLLVSFFLSTILWIPGINDFWVTRNNANMPVWVRGNIESGVFIIFNHGGPGSSGTLESIMEVSPANAQYDHESPLKMLEKDYAVVYWDQRASGMSDGPANPNDSTPNDFGDDLSAIIEELNKRYTIKSKFLIGQSWGHFVASNYLSSIESWQSNQKQINGYIAYKGNHAQEMAFKFSRDRMLSLSRLAMNSDKPIWLDINKFYSITSDITNLAALKQHYQYIDYAMGVSSSIFDRVYSSVRSSIFSPFNGWAYYFNNKATRSASEFLGWVATNNVMENKIQRIKIPTLLVYGKSDLIAPFEVGKHILNTISTPNARKRLVILENSRHGAEHSDVKILQDEIVAFIEQYRESPIQVY